MTCRSFTLFIAVLLVIKCTDAAFDITKIVPLSTLKAKNVSGSKSANLKSANNKNQKSGTPTSNALVVLAVENHRKIFPKVTWEGRSGGEGCSFIEKLFATKGCKTTKKTGEAEYYRPPKDKGLFARFLPFFFPSFATVLRVEIGVSGVCGKPGKTTSCSETITAFKSEGAIGATISPGCTRVSFQKKTSYKKCRKRFLFGKKCKKRCRWDSCGDTIIGMRIYANFENLEEFERLQLKGESLFTCPTQSADKLFTF